MKRFFTLLLVVAALSIWRMSAQTQCFDLSDWNTFRCINYDFTVAAVKIYYDGHEDYTYTWRASYAPDDHPRHTLMTEQGQDDICPDLNVLPPEGGMSVRLASTSYAAKDSAQGMACGHFITITEAAPIIKFRYAAVMENPKHELASNPDFYVYAQPNFNFIIFSTDRGEQVFLKEYYMSVPESMTGWKEGVIEGEGNTTPKYYMWKDWTTVSIDLSNHIGERMAISISAYDCSKSAYDPENHRITICKNRERVHLYYTLSCDIAKCGDNLTWSLNQETGVLTIAGTGAMYDYSYNNKRVPWYSFRNSITSVIIPNSVTSIGDYAFNDCSNLTSVIISNSVTSIGNSAFYGCSSLKKVTLNSNAIASKAYSSSSNLGSIFGLQVTEYILGDDVTSIGEYAFYGCSNLTSITIPNSVTSIGSRAFEDCNGLHAVHISDLAKWCTLSFSSYSANPLSYAHNLYVNGLLVTDLVIPDGVTSIGEKAFYGCSSLTSVTIPNSVTSIGNSAFYGCSSLTSVTIPNSVTSIGEYTFYGCSGLTSITIPNSVTSIGSSAFSGCSNITSLIIPNSVTSIGSSAFSSCSSLTSVTIGNSVTSIGNSAFYNCSSLTSITIPTSITSIGDYAFYNCKIDKIYFSGTMEEWCTKSFFPYSISSSYTLYINGEAVSNAVIPNSVTSIGESAFRDCSSLTSITIPNRVTSIAQGAFYNCSSLKNVSIASSVKVLEESAFYNCSNIETITCYGMRPPTVNTNALYGLSYSTIVYVPADYLNTYKMHDAWGLYDVRPLGATKVETEELTITPSDNTVDIVWPTITGATTYELIIRDTDGNIVCTLTFNAQGHLTQIAFNVPARGNAPEQTQTDGFAFTVTGLNRGTTYNYTLTSKDAAGNVLDTQTGAFTTDGATALDNTYGNQNAGIRKVFENGQLYILLPDNTRYNLQGMQIK